MKAGWYKRELDSAHRLVMGAKQKIDFLIPVPVLHDPNTVAELMGVLFRSAKAHDLKVRVLFSEDSASKPLLRMPAISWITDDGDEEFWADEHRFTQCSRETGLVLVDEASVVVLDGNEEDTGLLVSVFDDPNKFSNFREFFEATWTASENGISQLLYEQLLPPFEPRSAPQIATISTDFWSPLIRELSKRPEELYSLPPRKFEELIAHLLKRQGHSIFLTPQTRDGGKDLLVTMRSQLGELLYLIECKRHRPSNPVDVALVRTLYGVVEAEKATAGLLITTSTFTRDALLFRDQVKHRLLLGDFERVKQWLYEYR